MGTWHDATGNRKITAKINPGALSVVSSNDATRAREKIHHYLKQDRHHICVVIFGRIFLGLFMPSSCLG